MTSIYGNIMSNIFCAHYSVCWSKIITCILQIGGHDSHVWIFSNYQIPFSNLINLMNSPFNSGRLHFSVDFILLCHTSCDLTNLKRYKISFRLRGCDLGSWLPWWILWRNSPCKLKNLLVRLVVWWILTTARKKVIETY